MNDSHGYLDSHYEYFWKNGKQFYRKVGGYSRIKNFFDKIRNERENSVLILDNGDTIHGTYSVVKSKGKVLIPILNKMRFDAWTVHWDFAYGPNYLKDFSKKLNYPLLAINCYHKNTKDLVFEPYKVVYKNKIKIGIIGIANTIVDKTMPEHFSKGIFLTLGDKELNYFVQKLKKEENVDTIVVLSHLGYPQDVKLARETNDIDVFVSGHTHNRLYEPITVNGTIIIQSGCHGSFIGRVDLVLKNKKIVEYKHKLRVIDEKIVPDKKIQHLVDNALRPHSDILKQVVGKTKIGLARDRVLETTMDNLLLKALINVSGAEVAFSNGWRYGAAIPPGEITINDLWNIIPTNPPVSTCDISGEELIDMMEENLDKTFANNPYDQQGGYIKRCYGLNIYFKVENAKGLRIQEFFVGDNKIDRKKKYKAVFVTTQGIPQKYGENRKDLDIKAIDALKEYIKNNTPVNPELKGRIVPI